MYYLLISTSIGGTVPPTYRTFEYGTEQVQYQGNRFWQHSRYLKTVLAVPLPTFGHYRTVYSSTASSCCTTTVCILYNGWRLPPRTINPPYKQSRVSGLITLFLCSISLRSSPVVSARHGGISRTASLNTRRMKRLAVDLHSISLSEPCSSFLTFQITPTAKFPAARQNSQHIHLSVPTHKRCTGPRCSRCSRLQLV